MPTRRQILALAGTVPAALVLSTAAFANTPPVYANNGIAVDGSDVVAYFNENRPVKGSPDFAYEWNGATWHFANSENQAAFAADPSAFAPQFGGYCAWAVSNDYTAATVPEAWRIVDGKLYLNFSKRIQRRWERDIPGRIAAGNANWPDVLK